MIMKYSRMQRFSLIVASILVRVVGVFIISMGLVALTWFFLIDGSYKYAMLGGSLFLFYLGFRTVKYSFERMYNEFDPPL